MRRATATDKKNHTRKLRSQRSLSGTSAPARPAQTDAASWACLTNPSSSCKRLNLERIGGIPW